MIDIKFLFCKKFHKKYHSWFGFVENDSQLLGGKIPPYALLRCSKCGWAIKQRPAYQDSKGNWRVNIKAV